MFSLIKLTHLYSRHNPIVNTYLERDVYGPEDSFDMLAEEFMVAFTLEDYNTQQTKTDTRYVKFFAEYSNMTSGERDRLEISLHPCTDEEYARFYPVERRSSSVLNSFRTNPNRTLFCLGKELEEVILHGTLESGNFGALSFNALPCNHRLSHLGGNDDRIDPECVANLT